MRFVFMSDAHVGAAIPAAQQRVIHWCRREVLRLDPDRIVLGGDLTHQPDPGQAERFLHTLDLPGKRMMFLAGNNEGPAFQCEGEEGARPEFVRACETEAAGLFYLETWDSESAARSGQLLEEKLIPGAPALVFAHFRPELIPGSTLDRLATRPGITHWVCGHGHQGRARHKGNLMIYEAGGLDPVKVRGQRPNMLLIDWDGESATVEHLEVPAHTMRPPRPRAFPLGLAFRGPAEELMRTALDHSVSAVQFHYRHSHGKPTTGERDMARRFRAAMPHAFLSLHLPNFPRPLDGLDIADLDPWMEWASGMGVDDLTLHLPAVPASLLYDAHRNRADTPWAKRCVRIYTRIAARALDAGSGVSLENTYNKRRCEPEDDLLSSQPWHVPMLIEWIREALAVADSRDGHIGMIFDAGHAFRDSRVSKLHGLASWLHTCGPHLRLAHLHQVCMDPTGAKRNHQPIETPLGPMINYEGLLAVLDEYVPRSIPLLIEVRERENAVRSLQVLRAVLSMK